MRNNEKMTPNEKIINKNILTKEEKEYINKRLQELNSKGKNEK